jgi:peptide/nickel transport system substrate-binding protein
MARRLIAVAALALLSSCASHPPDAQLLTMATDVTPSSLDPRLGSDESSRRAHQLIYNSLLRYDVHGNPVADLAERWEHPDPLHYIFHLRKGVRFHRGGLLTSEDVRYTIESILRDEVASFRKGDFQVIAKVLSPDPLTVVFVLKEPFTPFLANLSLGIVPRGAGPEAARHPDGTGPFRFVSERRDQDLMLEANNAYFRGAPSVRRLRLKVVPEAVSRQLELLKGSVDLVVNDLTPDQVQTLRRSPDLVVQSSPSNSSTYLGFNLEDAILKDVRVRQAIAYALDREKIIRILLRGLARPSTGLLPPDNWAYEPKVRVYEQDLTQSRSLLDASGHPDPDGEGPTPRFTLTYKTTTNELAKEQANVFQEQLRRVGIDLEIRSFEWGTFYDDIKAGRFQIFSLLWTQLMDPDVLRMRFGSAYFPPVGFNRVRYVNAEVDRLLAAGSRAQDLAERKKDYRRIQQILAEDLPYVNLWHKANVAVYRARVQGFTLTPAADFYVLEQVSLR